MELILKYMIISKIYLSLNNENNQIEKNIVCEIV